jgi:RNA polymerase sigma-70 factor (ECF subfamily)
MADPPTTRASLLIRVRDAGDRQAWAEFVELYAPLVYGFARRRGLQDADAADLTQEVLRSVAAAVKRLDYDPQRGTFRAWLYTVTRNKLNTLLARSRREAQGSGDSAVQEVLSNQPAPEEDAAAGWQRDYEQRVFAWAAERVRAESEESTWQAFEQTALEGKPACEVAAALGMSVGAVYVAKSRVLARLKAQVRLIDDA